MWLRTFVGRSGFFQIPILLIYIIMPLRLAFDTIALIQSRIEPLRTVGNTGLVQNRKDQFIVKNLGVFPARKITVSLSPNLPAIGHAVCNLLGRSLPSRCSVGPGHSCLPEIFLRNDIRCNLAPLFGYLHIIHFKYHLTTRIADY